MTLRPFRLAAAAVLTLSAVPAAARVLEVGPGRAYPAPGAAAAAAQDGDTVAIAAGSYFDCAQWHASGLTIAGPPNDENGPLVTITDKACAGKAAFVIGGDGVTVRGISFERIRVPDGNGAGIRAEGRDLTVLDSRFVNDQIGILAGGSGGFLKIAGTRFTGNGASFDGRPTHAVLAGALDLLRIEHSDFQQARGGDHVVSDARRTELVADHFADAGGHMSGPLVWVNGGALLLEGSTVDLAGGAADRPGAVLVTGDADTLTVRGNTLAEPDGHVPLLRNWSGADAIADANTVPPNVDAVSDSGATYHRLRSRIAGLRALAHDLARTVRHQVADLARGWKLMP